MKGGKRKGAGRKKLPLDQKRVTLSCRVLPITKRRIESFVDNNVSVGKALDSIFEELFKNVLH